MTSSDMLLLAAFRDELRNVLDLVDETYQDEEWCAVHAYLTRRVKELVDIQNKS